MFFFVVKINIKSKNKIINTIIYFIIIYYFKNKTKKRLISKFEYIVLGVCVIISIFGGIASTYSSIGINFILITFFY